MASVALSAAFPIPVAHRWGRHQQRVSVLVHRVAASQGCHIRAAMAEYDYPNKLHVAPGVVKETVLKIVPESVRHLPWEKAEGVLISRPSL